MARRPRIDYPGALHHVTNRGLARRPVFENRSDIRYFLSLLGRVVRDGLLRVHVFTILPTHYHLLVESLVGRLSDAMQIALGLYVRQFNRRRARDGSLFRGRYWSRCVESDLYRNVLTEYIDNNAVQANLAAEPEHYPYCSAHLFAQASVPPWLSRRLTRVRSDRPPSASARELIEQRLRYRGHGRDPLDDLVRSAPHEVRRWMIQKSALADGSRPGLAIASASDVVEFSALHGDSRERKWLAAGLLRDGAGLSLAEIGMRLECSLTTAREWIRAYRASIENDPPFSETASTVLAACLRRVTNG